VNYCYYSPLLSENIKFKVFRTVNVCEISSFTLRVDRGLKVFEKKLLRTVLGHKSKQVTKHWRKLHGAEFHGLYSSPNLISVIKYSGTLFEELVAIINEEKGAA
jgi:hypothetical protein